MGKCCFIFILIFEKCFQQLHTEKFFFAVILLFRLLVCLHLLLFKFYAVKFRKILYLLFLKSYWLLDHGLNEVNEFSAPPIPFHMLTWEDHKYHYFPMSCKCRIFFFFPVLNTDFSYKSINHLQHKTCTKVWVILEFPGQTCWAKLAVPWSINTITCYTF